MKKFIAVIGLLVFLNPATVFAGDSVYVKAGAGFFNLEDAGTDFNFQGSDYDVGDVSFDGGYNLNAAVGNSFANGMAIELEFSYNKADADKLEGREFSVKGLPVRSHDEDLRNSDVSIKTLMVNGLYNYKNSSAFTPYAGAGIGFGWINVDGKTTDFSETNFAFQILAGVEYALTDNLALSTGYRYLNAGEISDTGTITVSAAGLTVDHTDKYSLDLDSHNFEAGIKYSF